MLKLSPQLFESIKLAGEKAFPNEGCGVILGRLHGNDREAIELFAANNSFDESEKYHRFLITPDDYRSAEAKARQSKLEILGFYHSHPDAPSVASKYDLDHAFPWFSYLIVSVMNGKYYDHHSWVMENDRSKFNLEEVIIR